MAKPLSFAISVPIGAYHPFLRDCLASLAAQEGPLNVALLDASGDERVEAVAHEFQDLFAYRRHGPDGGQSDAIIEGWKNTQSDILGWLNADDILFPGALAAAREKFASDPALGLVYGHSTILDDAKRTISYHWAVEPPGERLLEGGIISQPSCFFRRDAYDATGGLNASLHYTMDWDLWIRLYKSGAKFGFIDQVLSMVLWAEGTKTSSFNKQRRDELARIINEHAPEAVAKKTMRSFAIHNFLDRLPSKSFRKLVSRVLIRGRREIYGISGDGLIADSARLFLTHYDKTPKAAIRVTADNAGAIARITVNGKEGLITQQTGKTVDAAISAAVEPAQIAEIKFAITPGKRVYFTAAEWV